MKKRITDNPIPCAPAAMIRSAVGVHQPARQVNFRIAAKIIHIPITPSPFALEQEDGYEQTSNRFSRALQGL